jgi:hypothetical protein
MLRVLVVRAVVNMRGRRLVQAWDVEAIWGRRRMLHLVRTSWGVWERVRRRVLRLRRGELVGQAVVLRVMVGHVACVQSIVKLCASLSCGRALASGHGAVRTGVEWAREGGDSRSSVDAVIAIGRAWWTKDRGRIIGEATMLNFQASRGATGVTCHFSPVSAAGWSVAVERARAGSHVNKPNAARACSRPSAVP